MMAEIECLIQVTFSRGEEEGGEDLGVHRGLNELKKENMQHGYQK